MKLSYADDLKLYFQVNQRQQAVFLQPQLEAFGVRCSLNRMSLNISKCSVISCDRKKSIFQFDYALNGEKLKRESSVTGL